MKKTNLYDEYFMVRNSSTRYEKVEKPSKELQAAFKAMTDAAEKSAKEIQIKREAFLKELNNA